MFTTRRSRLARLAALCLPSFAGGCAVAAERPGFEAEARGAVEATMRGTTTFTPGALTLSAGDAGEASERGGTLVFAGTGGAGLSSGRYEVRDVERPRDLAGSGPTLFVNALFIAGTPSRPLGVFRGSAGALTVTAATRERIAGRFELVAVGVLTDASATRGDSGSVRLSGSFLVLDPCVAATSQAAAPCARQDRRAAEVRLRLSPSESTAVLTRSRN